MTAPTPKRAAVETWATLDCGCAVPLTHAQVVMREKGRRVEIGCRAHRRKSRVKVVQEVVDVATPTVRVTA